MTEQPREVSSRPRGVEGSGTGRYRFRLFVSGDSVRAQRAHDHILEALDRLDGPYDLEVVDVTERPDIAESARVIVTPMVVREFPPPSRRALGDLSDRVRLLAALDLDHPDQAGSAR